MLKNSSTASRRTSILTEQLLGQRAAFLRFLAAKVGPEAAEDILQSCHLKLVEKGPQLQKDESAVSWFYTVLRHATVDYYRRNATRDRAHKQFATAIPVSYEMEVRANICQCLPGVLETLKAEYRDALQAGAGRRTGFRIDHRQGRERHNHGQVSGSRQCRNVPRAFSRSGTAYRQDYSEQTAAARRGPIDQELTAKVERAYVDQGYTGPNAAQAAQRGGIRLEVVMYPTAKRGFVLLPRRRVVKQSFAWAARFRRLARDDENSHKHSKAYISPHSPSS